MSDNGKNEEKKDVKIAEVWVRDGSIMLDASPAFYADKLRAIGVMHYCIDIIKEFGAKEKKLISDGNMIDYARNIFKRKK